MPYRPPIHANAGSKAKRHIPEESAESRKNWYKRPAWQKLKKMILRRDPICTHCGVEPSYHVHHIQTLAEAPERGLDPSNLQGICARCHSKEHAHD